MRHYEIVFLIDSNQSHLGQSDQIALMIQRYTQLIESDNPTKSGKSDNSEQAKSGKGVVHRLEDLGRRLLAYPINKRHKAHYVLMNIECDQATLKELQDSFHFNDAIMRHLIIKKPHAITEPSVLAREKSMEMASHKEAGVTHSSAHTNARSIPQSNKGTLEDERKE